MRYAAGALLLDPDDPSRVLARTAEPLLSPETPEEIAGTVPNVVFPTAIEEIDGARTSSTEWPTHTSGSRGSTACEVRISLDANGRNRA